MPSELNSLMLETSLMMMNAPAERDQRYFQIWQRISVHLQKELRPWASEMYFRDPARCEDRDAAYPMIVYAACRPCYGRRPADFTYDIADSATLPAAWRTIGRAIQLEMEKFAVRLQGAPPALGRRYLPVWHEDVLVAVQKKPKRLIALLASEARLINALIDWGTMLNARSEKRFLKALACAAKIYGAGEQELAKVVLEGAMSLLARQISSYESAPAAFPDSLAMSAEAELRAQLECPQ